VNSNKSNGLCMTFLLLMRRGISGVTGLWTSGEQLVSKRVQVPLDLWLVGAMLIESAKRAGWCTGSIEGQGNDRRIERREP
jgi:hypothetical protein